MYKCKIRISSKIFKLALFPIFRYICTFEVNFVTNKFIEINSLILLDFFFIPFNNEVPKNYWKWQFIFLTLVHFKRFKL